jgi:hypothetical protein
MFDQQGEANREIIEIGQLFHDRIAIGRRKGPFSRLKGWFFAHTTTVNDTGYAISKWFLYQEKS